MQPLEKMAFPILIPELWCLGGMLFGGDPSIRTLDGYIRTRKDRVPEIERVNWINIVLDPGYKEPKNEKDKLLFLKNT